jgi:hypothetical protein
MSKKSFIVLAVILLAFAGCKDTDNASKWAGTYNATTGGLYTNNFSQVIMQESNGNTLRVMLDSGSTTYVLLQGVSVQSAASGTINETDSILGFNHPFQINGTVTLAGSVLTLNGTAINAYDTLPVHFYGTKQ